MSVHHVTGGNIISGLPGIYWFYMLYILNIRWSFTRWNEFRLRLWIIKVLTVRLNCTVLQKFGITLVNSSTRGNPTTLMSISLWILHGQFQNIVCYMPDIWWKECHKYNPINNNFQCYRTYHIAVTYDFKKSFASMSHNVANFYGNWDAKFGTSVFSLFPSHHHGIVCQLPIDPSAIVKVIQCAFDISRSIFFFEIHPMAHP